MAYRVVWFKRDLRINDHVPLAEAARMGPVLCLYVLEPSLWAQPDAAAQHLLFIQESLQSLDADLRLHGGCLTVAVGEVVAVLDRLHRVAPFEALYSHEETGNGHTFQRDRAVARWCRSQGVGWHERPQFGVVRGLKDRGQWKSHWEEFMAKPQALIEQITFVDFSRTSSSDLENGEMPLQGLPISMAQHIWPQPKDLGLATWVPPLRQFGGRQRGVKLLNSFLHQRSAQYRGGISSPLSAPTACSRLSAHLAYGTISMREVVQATRDQMTQAQDAGRIKQGLSAFLSRLYWHCHFVQKLECEPELEFQNMHRGYDGLREADWNPRYFEALTQGRTGWPMVDACVAMLRETGWLNFRMRAMLVSVAAYPLWLHWREVGHWLAREFLDYEPGIHWNQLQMQSGTTGINTARVYNPIKQALDHDPKGLFVRRWLPAMRQVPNSWLFEPWRMPFAVQAQCGLRVGDEIPLPVVDLEASTREAKARLYARRCQSEVRLAKSEIVNKHASRLSRSEGRRGRKSLLPDKQLGLDF